jgi:hypothetical protein
MSRAVLDPASVSANPAQGDFGKSECQRLAAAALAFELDCVIERQMRAPDAMMSIRKADASKSTYLFQDTDAQDTFETSLIETLE